MVKSAQKKNSSRKYNFKKQIILFCSCCATCLILLITSFNINSYLSHKRVLGVATETTDYVFVGLKKNEEFWKKFLQQNPNYFYAWIELATINLDLGDLAEARFAYDKARIIHPNSTEIRIIENRIR